MCVQYLGWHHGALPQGHPSNLFNQLTVRELPLTELGTGRRNQFPIAVADISLWLMSSSFVFSWATLAGCPAISPSRNVRLMSHCLRSLLVTCLITYPGCHLGLAGHCGRYTHLLLMVKRSLSGDAGISSPMTLRSPGPQQHCLPSFAYRRQPSLGFSEMARALPRLVHSSLKGISWEI